MIGLDAKIEAQKSVFNNKLFTSVVGNTYASYGRAFWNERQGQKIPELQVLSSTEYKEVLLDDSIDGLSFFLPEPQIAVTGSNMTANVGIYFAVNLDVLYPSVTERAVEYLHRDVLNLLPNNGFNVTGIVMGLEAFSQFGFVKESDNLEPFYLVRFDTEIEYNQNCTN